MFGAVNDFLRLRFRFRRSIEFRHHAHDFAERIRGDLTENNMGNCVFGNVKRAVSRTHRSTDVYVPLPAFQKAGLASRVNEIFRGPRIGSNFRKWHAGSDEAKSWRIASHVMMAALTVL